MFKLTMNEKGFDAEITLNETPNFEVAEEKPLKMSKKQSKKVDINVLKARAKSIQDKENFTVEHQTQKRHFSILQLKPTHF